MDIPALKIDRREKSGSNACRTMRQNSNNVPGILYGKGQDPVTIAADQKELSKIVWSGHHMVMIDAGQGERPAQFKEVQFDTYGDYVVHFDLKRIDLTDKIEVNVALVFKHEDDSPGLRGGGVIEKLRTEATILVPATEVPERIEVDLGQLDIGGHVTLGDLKLGENAALVDAPGLNVAICQAPKRTAEDEAGAEEGTAAEGEAKSE